MKKRIFSLFMTLCLLLSLFPSVLAAEPETDPLPAEEEQTIDELDISESESEQSGQIDPEAEQPEQIIPDSETAEGEPSEAPEDPDMPKEDTDDGEDRKDDDRGNGDEDHKDDDRGNGDEDHKDDDDRGDGGEE